MVLQFTNMKISATLKNNRGGQKTTADDTRILIELHRGNTLIGTVGLYNIIDAKVEGYRVVWDNGKGAPFKIIAYFEKGKQQTDNKCGHPLCGKTICRDNVPL